MFLDKNTRNYFTKQLANISMIFQIPAGKNHNNLAKDRLWWRTKIFPILLC